MIFISYSHDDEKHIDRVLKLSNRLRTDGFDCVIDQYEVSPPEGWPRWMEQKIQEAELVILVCTKAYFEKTTLQNKDNGAGVKWESNIIYQQLYNDGSQNYKFIPIILSSDQKEFIPRPLQGSSFYTFNEENYPNLCKRLMNLPNAEKPKLGKRKPLPEKEVKTDFKLFFSSPIDSKLWDTAKWAATGFALAPDRPPVIGLVFRDEKAAKKIFTDWRKRFGESDKYNELRVSIIQKEKSPHYSIHICSHLENIIKKFKELDMDIKNAMFMLVSRINTMKPKSTDNLDTFKEYYKKFGECYLAPQ